MANIKNKFSQPLSTEFSPKDLVVDIKNGHLYYKSNLGVHKLIGDNLSTNTEEGDIWQSRVSNIISYTKGNVGIGTTTPGEALEIEGNISASGDIRGSNMSASGDLIGVSASLDYLTTTGNVGIGTNAPNHQLHVSTSNDNTAFSIDIGDSATFDFKANSTSGYVAHFDMTNTALYIGHDSSARDLRFQTNNNDRITIEGGGDVGIGTTTPTEKLTVAGNISASGDIRFNRTDTTPSIKITGTANTHEARSIYYYHDDNNFFKQGYNPNGSDPPFASWFHYNGTGYPAMRFHNNGDVQITGNFIEGFSDIRLKKNIRKIENAIDKVKKIKGVHYDYNSKGIEVMSLTKSHIERGDDKNHIGVIAQEVQKVLPEVISPAPCDSDYMTVKYEHMVPLLIEAIKEQQKQIEDLKIQIEKLK